MTYFYESEKARQNERERASLTNSGMSDIEIVRRRDERDFLVQEAIKDVDRRAKIARERGEI